MPTLSAAWMDYTIPKLIRELKLVKLFHLAVFYYTIPKLIRELKPDGAARVRRCDYTIPKLIRELKRVFCS